MTAPDWVSAQADMEEAAALLAELVALRSLPGEELAVQQRVADWCRDAGMPVQIDDVEPGRPNVTVTLENGAGPTLLLNGHVDTASIDSAWDPARVWGVREDERLIGLGAGDMKSGVVAAMLATRALHRNRDAWAGTVIFSSVVDEEAYSIGARAVVASGVEADYCVVTESCFDWPCLGSFGKVLIRVEVTGKAAHASWPHLGVNAAVEAARFVERFEQVPLGMHPRITPSKCVLTFHAGPTVYESIVVPNRATVLINWHTVPGERADDVIAKLRAVVDELSSPAEFVFHVDPPYYPAWETPVDAPIVQAFTRRYEAETGHAPEFRYTGYGDMILFSDAGIPTIMFGPRGGNFHEAEEWSDLTSIPATTRVLIQLACDLLPA